MCALLRPYPCPLDLDILRPLLDRSIMTGTILAVDLL